MTVSSSDFEWITIFDAELDPSTSSEGVQPGFITKDGWRLEFRHQDGRGWVATRQKGDRGRKENPVSEMKEARTYRGVLAKECLIDLIANIELVLSAKEWANAELGVSEGEEAYSCEKIAAEACKLMKQDGYAVEIKDKLVMFRDPAVFED